jgi:small-conductance mechanosensitive channel
MIDTVGEWFDDVIDSLGFEVAASIAVVLVAVVVIVVGRRLIASWHDRIERGWIASDDHERREQGQRISTISGVVRLVISITVWIVVVLTVMAIWGIPMGPLVAVGATVGVAVGFGAQDFVRDVIAGFFVLLEDQYAVSDVVTIAGVTGSVEAVTLRTTVLRDLEGVQHHVPNGEVRVSSNYTTGFSRVVIDVPVSYDTDLDHAIEVILDEAEMMAADEAWSAVFIEAPTMLGVNELDESSVNIRVLLTTITEQRWDVKRAFLKRIKQRLDRESIEIPYRYLNVITPPS